MANYKIVDVITDKPLRNLSLPINSSAFNVRLSLSDIHSCILQKATVTEILPSGRKVRLNLNNYKADNGAGGGEIETPTKPGTVVSIPFISNILEDGKDSPYLVTGNAIKQYIISKGGFGEFVSVDGKSFKDSTGATIRIKRGNKIDLPILKQGELGLSLDEKKLYIGGTNNANISIPTEIDIKNVKDIIDNVKLSLANMPTNDDIDTILDLLSKKLDTVVGKGLSTNDYTNIDKDKVNLIDGKADKTVTDNLGLQITQLNDRLDLILSIIGGGGGGSNPLTISLNANITSAEMGSTINSVTFTWSYNKEPLSQQFDGQVLTNSLRSYTYTTPITTNKTFTLSAAAPEGGNKTASVAIKFLNGVYYGISSSKTYDNSLVLSLNKTLSDTKSRSINVDAAGDNDYIYYCLPTRLGSVSFKVGGFDGGFAKVATVPFTNASGYTENYDIYRSDNSGLGLTAVDIQ